MGDVRSRLDAERRKSEPEEGKVPFRTTSRLVVGHPPTASTRERSEAEATLAHDEVMVKPDKLRSYAGAMTASRGFNLSCRDSEYQKAFLDEEKASPEASAAAEFYLAAYEAERKKEKAAHDRDVASGRLIEL